MSTPVRCRTVFHAAVLATALAATLAVPPAHAHSPCDPTDNDRAEASRVLAGHDTSTALAGRPHAPVSLALTPADDARRFIEKIATNKLRAFKATIDPATGEYLDDPYAQNKSLSEHVAADYHGRCLIELIQNGNDAHPRDRRDGEVEVLLADEGPFGTVYVANRGLPFSRRQVYALSRIGKSSKPPGEAIGNKGLGFRSVSHVCDAPEIYSQSAPAVARPAFNGFCFTLEHGSALDGYFDNPRIDQLAERDLPMFSVPRWLSEQPGRVRDFADRGFASVVRLVLRDEEARADALGQFRLLMNQSVPTLLFMERLCRLTTLVEDADAASPPLDCPETHGNATSRLTAKSVDRRSWGARDFPPDQGTGARIFHSSSHCCRSCGQATARQLERVVG